MGAIYSKDGNKYSAMPAASLALGIISFFTVFFWYINLITGILAIVFGVKSIHRTNSKVGRAGMIVGIVSIVLCVCIYMFFIGIIIRLNM